MDYDILVNQLNLKEKSKIMLLLDHKQNQQMLKNFLQDKYQINVPDFRVINREKFSQVSPDMIIVDENSLEKNINLLQEIKKSKSLFLPLLLVTRISLNKIPGQIQTLIDQIVQIPIQKNVLNYRIKNLLNLRKLFLSTQIYQKLTEKNPVGICILQDNKYIKYVNQAFTGIIEKKEENILGKEIKNIFPAEELNNNLKQESSTQKKILSLKVKQTAQEKWLDIRFSRINYEHINLTLLIIVDITKQKKSEEKIRYLSFHDQLTDLYNRDYFMEELQRLNTERQLPLTLIMGDINSLKLVNDAFGHKKGDLLIQKVAQVLGENVRDEDILARIGGDEFGIILPQTSNERGEQIVKRIKNSCSETKLGPLEVSIALGTAVKTDPVEDINKVFQKADDKMYENKMAERNRIKDNIISTLKDTLLEKTQETKNHFRRMEKLIIALADKMNLPPKQKKQLKLLAHLHDIGKVALSEMVLKKSGLLKRSEFEKVKSHAEIGYRIAQSIPELSTVAEIILSHHEHWDGKGYPQGLQKEEIPLMARIVSIVDSYVVITAQRSYKCPRSKEQALAEIRKCAGSQFDPELVSVFMEIVN
ncbi:MAG: diguanylate cyclase domain-containing protein [Halanaerobiaceae bacterium]